MAAYTYHDCDSCGQQAGGYSKTELEKQGWVWNAMPNSTDKFVMCDECVHEYELRRTLRNAVTA